MVNGYIVKRVGQAIITIYGSVTLSFFLIRALPGGPVAYLRAKLATENIQGADNQERLESLNQLVEIYLNYDPTKPLWQQYVEYMWGALQGDLGKSVWTGESVNALILEALPWTILYSSISLVLLTVIGILLGAMMAYFEGSRFDSFMTVFQTVRSAIPYYIFAIYLLSFFAFQMDMLPAGGHKDPNTTFGVNIPYIIGVLEHATLPIASLVIAGFGARALAMRGNSIQVLESGYMRAARLRGVQSRRLITHYVTKNAILPMYTGILISIGGLFSGSVILETIFAYPGLGKLVVDAFTARDYPLMMGSFIILTVVIVIAMLFADLTYGLIDPRIEVGENGE